MIDEPLVTHKRIKVYADRDTGLRAHEYTVVLHDRDGKEVGGFTFYVSDMSGRLTMGPFVEADKFFEAAQR